MLLMVTGLLVFSVIHLAPALFVNLRANLVKGLGLWPFRVLLSILMVGSITCIVLGWQGMEPRTVYDPPAWGRYATFILVLLMFILLASLFVRSNIQRLSRHVAMIGVVLWSLGHLLANGESRSVLFFSWLGVWAILEILAINRREGKWKRPPAVPLRYDVLAVLAGTALFAIVLFLHPYFTGVRPVFH